MIEETPPLVFAPAVERPPTALVERFPGTPTSFVVDAMGGAGALDWRMRPIVGRSLLCENFPSAPPRGRATMAPDAGAPRAFA